MIDTATIPETKPPLTDAVLERLRSAAREAAAWDVIHQPATDSDFPERAREARRSLKKLEEQFAQLSGEALRGSVLLEVRANQRMLRSAITGISDRARELAALPRVVVAAQEEL